MNYFVNWELNDVRQSIVNVKLRPGNYTDI